jgi:hypothetical protein
LKGLGAHRIDDEPVASFVTCHLFDAQAAESPLFDAQAESPLFVCFLLLCSSVHGQKTESRSYLFICTKNTANKIAVPDGKNIRQPSERLFSGTSRMFFCLSVKLAKI